ncbi:MAG: glycosyltransferase family 9 protein [Candidatus Kaistia colombiensis]|nr:MAG: glycosyltransferase family 9 protein [Kaistia sp.]
MAARFLRDVLAVTGPLAIDIYSPKREVSAWIFRSLAAPVRCFDEKVLWERLRPSYVASFYVTQFAMVHAETADWAFLSDHAPKLFEVCTKLEEFRPSIEECIQHHPRLDGHLGRIATFMGFSRRTFLQGMANIPYRGDVLPLEIDPGALEKFGLADRPYVTVHNGFDAEFDKAAPTSTKVYAQFEDVIVRLKRLFPDICVVQIGTVTSKPIGSADVNLIGATTIRELAAIVKHSRLNIDNESGIVHLASCFDVRSCVVFGPTSVDYYAYPQNINLRPPVCGECWWVNETWMNRCAKGHEQALCMSQRSPESVFAALKEEVSAWYAVESGGESFDALLPNDRRERIPALGFTAGREIVDNAVRILMGLMPAWLTISQLVA